MPGLQRLRVRDTNLSLLELYQWLYARRRSNTLLVYKRRFLMPNSQVRLRELGAITGSYLGMLDLRVHLLQHFVQGDFSGSMCSLRGRL